MRIKIEASKLAVAILLAAPATALTAQTPEAPVLHVPSVNCASYAGQTVAPITIDAAMARYAGMTPRGEFESTAEFEARRARAGGTGPLIIGKIPDPERYGDPNGRGDFFRYDADRQVLRIISYAFDNKNFTMDDIFGYGAPMYREGDYTPRFSNVDVVISETNRPLGSYRGRNAFGVAATVIRVNRTLSAIYDRPLPGTSEGLFPHVGPDNVVGELHMDPVTARHAKLTMRVAFVVVPKEPFVVSHTTSPSTATIDNPQEVTVTTRVLFADIQCALLLDERNTVLGAYETQ